MKNISLSLHVHQPVLLKKYCFSDISIDQHYYDDFENEKVIKEAADNYLTTNEILANLIRKHKGTFRISLSISGTAIDLFSLYAPQVIGSFQRLAETGCVEFIAETYSHSLASLKDKREFVKQVNAHAEKIEELFGRYPTVFKNTELIYSDTIGEIIADMGFKAIIAEGARHILKWRSPNYLYRNPIASELGVLIRNTELSEDIAFRMANADWTGWPKMVNNYLTKLNKIPEHENIVNLFMDYETISQGQKKATTAFNFLKSFPSAIFEMTDYTFKTPSEIIDYNKPISEIQVHGPVSRTDNEGGDLSAWMGNDFQNEAIQKLYGLQERVNRCNDTEILKDWRYLQTTDHFYFMCSKFFSNKEISSLNNPYNNPYEAFMNYMNVLNDFTYRVNRSMLSIKTDYVQKKLHNRLVV